MLVSQSSSSKVKGYMNSSFRASLSTTFNNLLSLHVVIKVFRLRVTLKNKFAVVERSVLTNEQSCTVGLTNVKEVRTNTVLLKVSKCYEADEI